MKNIKFLWIWNDESILLFLSVSNFFVGCKEEEEEECKYKFCLDFLLYYWNWFI